MATGRMELSRVNRFVLHKQHLVEDSGIDDAVQMAARIGGLHATSATTPYLSLFARCRSFQREVLDHELYVRRRLGRLRCMRKTIYILPKEMMPIAHRATAALVQKASRRYMEFQGVPREEYDRLSEVILEMVRGEGMTASAIRKALQTHLDISAILYLMCDEGLLVRGKPDKGWKDRQYRYIPFAEQFPDVDLGGVSEEEAITRLVRRYLLSFGPVTENDVVWWTGLGKRKVRAALMELEKSVVRVHIAGLEGELAILRSDEECMTKMELPQGPVVNLLPVLDPYLMGYKDRERYIEPRWYNYVFDRSGNATSTILVNGRVTGVWDIEEDGGRSSLVKLHFFQQPTADVRESIYAQARRTAEFIVDGVVKLGECGTMIPLPRRPAGGVMSPLRDC